MIIDTPVREYQQSIHSGIPDRALQADTLIWWRWLLICLEDGVLHHHENPQASQSLLGGFVVFCWNICAQREHFLLLESSWGVYLRSCSWHCPDQAWDPITKTMALVLWPQPSSITLLAQLLIEITWPESSSFLVTLHRTSAPQHTFEGTSNLHTCHFWQIYTHVYLMMRTIKSGQVKFLANITAN